VVVTRAEVVKEPKEATYSQHVSSKYLCSCPFYTCLSSFGELVGCALADAPDQGFASQAKG
jgi:hypothetical protein